MHEPVATFRTAKAAEAHVGERPPGWVTSGGALEQPPTQVPSSTAVEQFADWHNRSGPASRAASYHALLPAQPPGPGQQYAFDVDLDRCSGCKACVTACHSLNGLDEGETWRDVGLLVGGTSDLPMLQHVTTACHHCLEPACLSACPVNAYEKDPQTGIVKHLDDQCFDCQYCTLACPYEVPKYHPGKGIVRKCDMCTARLTAGEAPACVQACPHQAIRIQVVDLRQTMADAEAGVFLPAAPDPLLTLPTTTYRTTRGFPRNTLPADYFDVHPQHAHGPLVVMLVLTQLSVGACLMGTYFELSLPADQWSAARPVHAVSTAVWGMLALLSSTFHLGRPQYAFRAVLGLRHSWLSREIVGFSLFMCFAMLDAVAVFAVPAGPGRWLAGLVSLTGIVAVLCSVMIYAATPRELWTPLRTGMKFLLTTGLLGAAAVWLTTVLAAWVWPSPANDELLMAVVPTCGRVLQVLVGTKLLAEITLLRHLCSRRMTSLKRSALLMTRPLARITCTRVALGVLGGLLLPAVLLNQPTASGPTLTTGQLVGAIAVGGICLGGELLERLLFFRAVASPRMPGPIR